MATDVLSIGGIAFTGYAPPDEMMGGGKQALVVHKLPGGERVIDTLGPDESDIAIRGFFFDDNAYGMALALDAMRADGSPVALVWGGQYRTVIVEEFIYRVKRLPIWVEYQINLVVVSNPSLGVLGSIASTVDTLVSSDLSVASGL